MRHRITIDVNYRDAAGENHGPDGRFTSTGGSGGITHRGAGGERVVSEAQAKKAKILGDLRAKRVQAFKAWSAKRDAGGDDSKEFKEAKAAERSYLRAKAASAVRLTSRGR